MMCQLVVIGEFWKGKHVEMQQTLPVTFLVVATLYM